MLDDELKLKQTELLKTSLHITEIIDEATVDISTLNQQLDELEGKTCTGTEYWRDQDHPTKAPKLYIIHSTGESCPLHGEPNGKKRIRSYIGTDAKAIAEAREAIRQESRRRKLESRRDTLRSNMINAQYYLDKFIQTLGYRLDGNRIERRRARL